MANSFLVLAKIEEVNLDHEIFNSNILAYYFSIDRLNSFRTKTTFQINKFNKIGINKSGGGNDFSIIDLSGNSYKIKHQKNDLITEYLNGELLAFIFSKSLSRGSIYQINELLKMWLDFLFSRFFIYDKNTSDRISIDALKGYDLSSILIDGEALDCGPHNLILFNGKLSDFDLEWVVNSPIPLSWVLKRSIDHILRFGYAQEKILATNDLIGLICENIGVTARTSDIEEASDLELKFQTSVGLSSPSAAWGLHKIKNS